MADAPKPAPKPAEKPAEAKAQAPDLVYPKVDPDNVPAELSAGVKPDPGGDKLLAAAQAKAPHITRAFLAAHDLDDEYLALLARGEESPPPYIGPTPVVDLHRTDGGWQITPKGVKPEDVGASAISR
jgi:hypothetical protein